MTTFWQTMRACGALQPIDAHFGAFVRRQAEALGTGIEDAELIARSAALVSREQARGHSCVALVDWSGEPFDRDDRDATESASAWTLPDCERWTATLTASSLVADSAASDERAPLVLDEGRLFLHRCFAAESRVGNRLAERVGDEPDQDRPDVRPLFPPAAPTPDGDDVDWQAVAACIATRSRFTAVLGGPGTGKTTTVARILALLLNDTARTVALAAPTGKAAARLSQSIRAQRDELPAAVRGRLDTPATTLHRLLGYVVRGDRFRRNARSPLSEDIVVVDEASMVDLSLMDALLDALRPDARLILCGDPDQLTSVASGNVLGDVFEVAAPDGRYGTELVDDVRARASVTLAERPTPGSGPLTDHVVVLRRNWRFDQQRGVASLANAVRGGRADLARAILADERAPDATSGPPPTQTADVVAAILPWLEDSARADGVTAALDAFDRWQVLCAVREGPQGVVELNRAVEAWLEERTGRRIVDESLYPGRPVLVTANDHRLGIYNGDVGILWPDPTGRTMAWFRTEPEAPPREYPPSRLPPHETAWAITVHKSQGSEYDRVQLVLPERDSRVCTRELVYTGVTRARAGVHVLATPAALAAAIGRRNRRTTGLARRLRDPAGTRGTGSTRRVSCQNRDDSGTQR